MKNKNNKTKMDNKNYIQIPTIKSLKIKNYPLFNFRNKDHWIVKIIDGINLILGANSIGKTTTMNLIKFAFIGNSENIDSQYFESRISKQERKIKNQCIILEFLLLDELIEIHRNIQSAELERFIINGKEKTPSEYLDYLQGKSKLSLRNFADLLELMLIRVEEGNYILWDKNAQRKIFSALLNDVEFQKQIAEDEEKFKRFEEKCNSIKNLINDKKRREHDLKKSIEEQQIKQKKEGNLLDLKDKLRKSKLRKEQLGKKRSTEQKELNLIKERAKKIFKEYEDLRLKYNRSFAGIEQSEIVINRLKEKIISSSIDDKCILCTTKIPKTKAEKIHTQFFYERVCPACDSSLGKSTKPEDSKILKNKLLTEQSKLKKLRDDFGKTKIEFEQASQIRKSLNEELSKLRNNIDLIDRELYQIDVNILDVENIIDLVKQKSSKKTIPTNYDVLLLRSQQEIKNLEKEYTQEKKRGSKLKIRTFEQRRKRNEIILNFYQKLNSIFKKYSKEYFSDKCELAFQSSKGKNSWMNVNFFIPNFRNVIRLRKDSVSHSEAIFLEYLFRVSLLELYYGESKIKPFLF